MITEIVVAAIAGTSAVIGAWLNSRKSARHVQTVAAELKPNHGSSLRDAVDRIESSIILLHETVASDRRSLDRAWERVDSVRGAVDQLAAQVSRLHPDETIRID